MSKCHAWFICLAVAHLTLVVCGAASLSPRPRAGLPGAPVRWSRAMSGADNNYGFFAPGVSSQFRAVFTLTGADGRTWKDTLERGANPEADARLGGTVAKMFSLGAAEESPDLQRALAAS